MISGTANGHVPFTQTDCAGWVGEIRMKKRIISKENETLYMEAMKTLSEEIESLFNRTLASVRDDIHPTDDGQSERSCSGFPKSLKS